MLNGCFAHTCLMIFFTIQRYYLVIPPHCTCHTCDSRLEVCTPRSFSSISFLPGPPSLQPPPVCFVSDSASVLFVVFFRFHVQVKSYSIQKTTFFFFFFPFCLNRGHVSGRDFVEITVVQNCIESLPSPHAPLLLSLISALYKDT